MKKGEIYEGIIEKVEFPNKGFVWVDDQKVIVKNGIPGQKVRFMINKKRSGRAEGRLLEVLEKSPLETREPACQEFPACGGCMYQTMSYEAQKEMKECQVRELLDGAVRESLAKIGENSDVFSRTLRFNRINWMAVDGLHGEEHRLIVKVRYGHKGAP